MSTPPREIRVARRIDWAPGLFSLVFEQSPPPFEPGQFVNLGVEREGRLLTRSYSIVSAPGAPLEVLLTEVEGGALTPTLARVGAGTSVLLAGAPQGFFTLRWVPPARDLWLLATGTGLSPYLSLLREASGLERFERVVLVHGVREARHHAYRAELEDLARHHGDRLVYLRAVTREAPGDALQGRLTELLDRGELERAAGVTLSPEHSHLMLCGNPHMVDEMSSLLAERGLVKHRPRRPGHVTFEKYW